MTQSTMTGETIIGVDLGDRKSHICVLSSEGEVYEPLRDANRFRAPPSRPGRRGRSRRGLPL